MPNNDINIVVKASVDDAVKSLDKVNQKLDGVADTVKKGTSGFKQFGLSLTDLKSGLDLAGQAAGMVGKAFNATVGEAMDYNKQIRDLAQNLNITTEETSRIIQTADDFTVSQEDVTTALQMAVKNGIKPSINTLAQMADLYNSISDPTERATKLTEVFGRNWTVLTPMLKEGGRAIRDTAAAQDDALIVTQKQSDATRDLEKNIDNLNDKFTALKLKVGNAVIPVLNDAATSFERLTEGMASADQTENELGAIVARDVVVFGQQSRITQDAAEALRQYLWNKKQTANEEPRFIKMHQDEANALNDVSKALQDGITGYGDYYQRMGEAIAASKNYNDVTSNLIINTKELNQQTLYKIAAEGLDADAALQLARSMGMVDDKTASNIQKQRDLLKAYQDGKLTLSEYEKQTIALGRAIDALPNEKTIRIQMELSNPNLVNDIPNMGNPQGRTPAAPAATTPKKTTPTTTRPTGRGPQAAAGLDMIVPPGYPGDNYPIYTSSGEHVTVTPRGAIGSGVTINNYITPSAGMDVNNLAAAVSRKIARDLRGVMRS